MNMPASINTLLQNLRRQSICQWPSPGCSATQRAAMVATAGSVVAACYMLYLNRGMRNSNGGRRASTMQTGTSQQRHAASPSQRLPGPCAARTLSEIREEEHRTPQQCADIDKLRADVLRHHKSLVRAQDALQGQLRVGAGLRSTRAGYLQSLRSQIGPRPENRKWQDEWVALGVEHFRITGQYSDKSEQQLAAHCRDVDSIEQYVAWNEDRDVPFMVARGWPRADAIAFELLRQRSLPIAAALRRKDDRFAASTYTICDVIFRGARRDAHASDFVPENLQLYCNLRSAQKSRRQLIAGEPRWANIEIPDCKGFCGLTSSCITRFFSTEGELMWHENGLLVPQWSKSSKGKYMKMPQDSDVVCVLCAPPDIDGFHCPVRVGRDHYAFPPNTLFRLKDVQPEFEAPGGIRVKQRLLTVTATFKAPSSIYDDEVMEDMRDNEKMCNVAPMLQYADSTAYIEGLDDILAHPTLSMAAEFRRDMVWRDWKGCSHTLHEQWAYVNGRCSEKLCSAGLRDFGRSGRLPADFVREINRHIAARRNKGYGLSLSLELAMLSKTEVLAVRLYSGPSYQPINTFLRAIATTHGQFRRVLAREPSLTFCATVKHICDAIRKLAAVSTPVEASMPLYRGVRGQMPKHFWVPDEGGMVCATDTAFTSTSREKNTPLQYMASDVENVLWKLQPTPQDDTGFHCGADISSLSQFAAEQEVLFPPYTMLRVLSDTSDVAHNSTCVERQEVEGVRYLEVAVRPSFV